MRPFQQHKPAMPRPASGGANAFSLVEIALALGIMAFVLIAVVGLLPVGLKMLRDSEEGSVNSLIYKDVAARLEVYSNRPSKFRDATARNLSYLYDSSGLFLAESTTAAEPVAPTGYKQIVPAFLAKVTIGPLAVYPPNVTSDEILGVSVKVYTKLRPGQGGQDALLGEHGFLLPMKADKAWPAAP